MHKLNPKSINTTLYIGELDQKVTSDKLKKLFSKYGTITSITLSTQQSPKLNFGYIKMSNICEARACVEKLDKFIIDGSPIMVRL